ncbi:CYFIP-related Rac1 interactor A-like isoform X2 [Falco naumanni]|uniref:CYFIP-related Rac1 interactor A-like isoform X2 n=1 Tax=Falco naumanni TaxID=148594 RepID=UPI001ADE44FF|nr:CYFIP-related Rac1 interactor A-like isoform X2 [Falco naumanni]XP_040443739.1 CYFIP-related Rac1 interactor A-like isoform X2 [Falco naumanni]
MSSPPPLPSGGLPGEGGPRPPGQTHGRGLSPCTSSPGPLAAPWGQPGAEGSGTPARRTVGQGSQDSPPPAPSLPLGPSWGKETDQGEKPARKGCGLAGEPRDGVLAPPSGSRRPGPRSEPSGFLSPGRCPADAQPTEAETAVWNQVNAVLEEAQAVLAELQSYTGAGQEIREAIQNPGDLRLQERAWSAVCPLVAKLKRFYEFSLRLENALRSLLEALTSPPYAPTQHLEREQALAKQFAEILHFTLSFDELKMTNPAIQNDFSYYRRTISRNRINNLQLDAESEVNNEMANRMSLFYAEATPMLKTLSNATTKFVSENKTLPIEDTTDCLSTMACVCRVMLETPEYRSRFTNTETLLFCMRVMVGVIILYDHVHPVGAFAKTSKIDMKGCIKVLKDQPSTSTEGLLNALRYTTRHLNDDTTSKQIRALLQ